MSCCCGCVGSCFPYTCDEAGVCTLTDIPWQISAPNCPAIDGLSGVFTPLQPNPSVFTTGSCGPCVCYQSLTLISMPGQRKVAVGGGGTGDLDPEGPPPICSTFPCDIQLRLYLGFDPTAIGCCTASIVVEMITADLALVSGSPQKINTVACIPQATPVDNTKFRQFALDSCVCLEPLNTGAGFSGLFDLSRIQWVCSLGDFPIGSPCYPSSRCCELLGCSLAGATLSL